MNQRIEKSATVLILNRDKEGEELWTAMYDLLFDYRALLLDYNALESAARKYLNIHRSLPPVEDTVESWNAQFSWDLERDLLGDELATVLP